MIPAAGAVVLYAAVLADALLHGSRIWPGLSVGAAAGAILLAAALWRGSRSVLGWSVVIAGAVYIAALAVRRSGVDGTAPIVAAGLFLCAELARWSFELRVRISGDELLVARRAGALVALAIGAALASALVVGSAAIGASRSVAWTALGAVAAAGAAGIGVWLARR